MSEVLVRKLRGFAFLYVLLITSIFVHETAHMLMATHLQMIVTNVNFGYVSLIRISVDGISYGLGAIPVGGITRIPDMLEAQIWKRMLVAVVGPSLNIFVGIIVCAAINVRDLGRIIKDMLKAIRLRDIFRLQSDRAVYANVLITVDELLLSRNLCRILLVWGKLNLLVGLFNLLPVPALDGGRLLFALLELVFGKGIRPFADVLTMWSALMLLMFMLFSFEGDVKQVFHRNR